MLKFEDGTKLILFMRMDYYGYVMDYILDHIDSDTGIISDRTMKLFNKQRKKYPGNWLYSPHYPFADFYTLPEKRELDMIADEQLARKKAEGVLLAKHEYKDYFKNHSNLKTTPPRYVVEEEQEAEQNTKKRLEQGGEESERLDQ
jgi:hypothetical protein